jgi:hypothetical protein
VVAAVVVSFVTLVRSRVLAVDDDGGGRRGLSDAILRPPVTCRRDGFSSLSPPTESEDTDTESAVVIVADAY